MQRGETAGQRRLARVILGSLVATLVLFVVLASSPGLGFNTAQAGGLLFTHNPTSASPSSASPSDSPSSASPTSSDSPTPSESPSSASPTPSNSTSASPTPTESAPPPPIAYTSTTTLSYKRRSFVGRVKSDGAGCRRERVVVLKKKRPGRDKKLGSDVTNRRGRYEIRKRKANGTYYSVALNDGYRDRSGREVFCQKDRSRNEKV